MTLIFEQQPRSEERPAGITFVAALLFAYACAASVYAVLIATGNIAMSRGAWVVGGGLEILGPGIFALYAVVHFVTAFFLWRMKKWAQRVASLLLVYGLVQVTPAISSAVADSRVFAIAREGMQIIWRVVALWYLWQEPIRESFERQPTRR